MSRAGVGVLAAIGAETIYGISFVFTKSAVGIVTPAALLAWRFLVAFVVLGALAAVGVVKLTLKRSHWPAMLALAACQPLAYYAAETLGVQLTTASESGLILAMIPVAAIVCAAVLLGRKPTRQQFVGVTLTLVGVVATVVAGGLRAEFNPIGYLCLLGAVLSYALYTVLADRDQATSSLDKTFAMIAVGAVVFTLVAVGEALSQGTLRELATLPVRQPVVLGSIAYLALGSSIAAFFLQAVAIERLGSTRFSTFIGLSTLTAIAAAALVLGERLSPLQLAGGGLILAGVYIANAIGASRSL